MRVEELLGELLPVDATSGGEQEILALVEGWLTQRGLNIEPIPVGSTHNIFACSGEAKVILTTHLDTVPPHLPWHEDEETFYGRGACDAKGIAAAMMVASEALSQHGVPHGLLFLVEEETTSAGAKAAATALADRGIECFINGEPTQNRWVRGSLGVLAAEVHFQGKAAHSSTPECGHSAVHDLLDTCARWRALDLPEDEDLGPSFLNIGIVEGGKAANVLAPSASASILARCSVPAHGIQALLMKELPQDARWNLRSTSDPQRMIVPHGADSLVVPFGSDVPFLSAVAPCRMLGPGDIRVAHSSEERIAKADLQQAVGHYVQAVLDLTDCLP